MSVNAYIFAKALGEDYIEKPPSWLRDVLLKLYIELSREGDNVNQIAHNVNKDLVTAEAASSMADKQRVPMFRLMEAIELALSGGSRPMIIKSHVRGGYRDAAAYLKDQGENKVTRLVEMSDPHVKDLDEAFRAMRAVADGSKVKKPLHHISINPMKDGA